MFFISLSININIFQSSYIAIFQSLLGSLLVGVFFDSDKASVVHQRSDSYNVVIKVLVMLSNSAKLWT